MINIQVATFIQSLINDSSIQIILARSNYENIDFDQDLILVDTLASAIPTNNIDSYNDISEQETLTSYYNQSFTLDFYGANAFGNAYKFIALLRSERANWYAKDNEITSYYAKSIVDLKQLTGTEQQNRYQVEFNVGYYVSTVIDTLRIDSVDYEITYIEE